MEIPFLKENIIMGRAESFLERYHPSLKIPIPIELIVERDLGIQIIPIRGLSRGFHIDAFITSDFTEIHVDEGQMMDNEQRYRFTLAHEIGHMILHREAYRTLAITNLASWKNVQATLEKQIVSRLEIQAHVFASFLLMPEAALKDYTPGDVTIQEIADDFNVSFDAAVVRLKKKYT